MENKLTSRKTIDKDQVIYAIVFAILTLTLGIFMGGKFALLAMAGAMALPIVYKYQFLFLNLFMMAYAFLPDIVILAAEILFFVVMVIDLKFNKKIIKANTLLIPMFLVGIFMIINSFTSLNILGSMRDLAFNFGGIFLALMVYKEVNSKERLNNILTSIAIGATLVGVFGLYQFVFLGTVQREWIDASLKGVITRRAYSVFMNPNIFAEYLVLVTPLVVSQFWAHRDGFKKFIYLMIAGLLLLNMMLTFSRGGMVSIALAAMVFLFFAMRPLFVFLIPIGIFSINFLPEKIQNRIYSIFNFADSSTSYRFKMWGITKDLIRDNPMVGVGFGHKTFKQEFELLIRSMPIFHAHNTYLEIMAEGGALGIISFLYIVIGSIVNLFKSGMKSTDKYIRTVSIGLLASIIGILTNGMTEHIVYINRIIVMLWMVFGLTGALRNIYEDEKAKANLN
ncbi:O-antigen ligase family protein [Ezakiella peruensis]|uniref:O-antigen ligase family protein n=1 Tax=Ezakiella peruensis TaxID=1464038 RepID=UPI001472F7E1|nr:O-antigen ligase family protein [Ezakiella peruensis]